MRYVVGRINSFKISKNVNKILRYEKNKNIDNIKGCKNFKKIVKFQKKLLTKLKFFKKENTKLLDMQLHLKAQQFLITVILVSNI